MEDLYPPPQWPAAILALVRPHLHPVSIHLVEENAEGVRLGGDVSVQQAASGDGHFHTSDAVLRRRGDAASLALRGRAQSVGHDLRSQSRGLEKQEATSSGSTHFEVKM